MTLPVDIIQKLHALFAEADWPEATALVEGATLHDNGPVDLRCQRCALQASGGSLEKLVYYVDLLKIDFRDVIVAGEYEVRGGFLARVRDLTEPFDDSAVS